MGFTVCGRAACGPVRDATKFGAQSFVFYFLRAEGVSRRYRTEKGDEKKHVGSGVVQLWLGDFV